MKKAILTFVITVSTFISVWLIGSTIDVMAHNSSAHPSYAEWNVFTMIFEKE